MNTQDLFDLVNWYERKGLGKEEAFERAFFEYKQLMERLKVRAV